MLPSKTGFLLLSAFFVCKALALTIPVDENGVQITSLDVYNEVRTTTTALEVRDEVWEGPQSLMRRDSATWFGSAATYWGIVAFATCTPASPLISKPFCALAVAVAALGFVFSVIAGIVSAARGDMSRAAEMNDRNGYYSWEFPSVDGGPSMLDQARNALTSLNDGLPVRVGNTSCAAEGQVCHSIWYSTKKFAGKNVHKVHVTPHYFDFRFPPSSSPSSDTGSALRPRQTESVTSSTGTSQGDLYGGFEFSEASPGTLSGLYDLGQSTFVDNIGVGMSNDFNSGTYGHSGAYCMDFTTASGSSGPGTDGFFWLGNSGNGFPSGGESGFYGTCVNSG